MAKAYIAIILGDGERPHCFGGVAGAKKVVVCDVENKKMMTTKYINIVCERAVNLLKEFLEDEKNEVLPSPEPVQSDPGPDEAHTGKNSWGGDSESR